MKQRRLPFSKRATDPAPRHGITWAATCAIFYPWLLSVAPSHNEITRQHQILGTILFQLRQVSCASSRGLLKRCNDGYPLGPSSAGPEIAFLRGYSQSCESHLGLGSRAGVTYRNARQFKAGTSIRYKRSFNDGTPYNQAEDITGQTAPFHIWAALRHGGVHDCNKLFPSYRNKIGRAFDNPYQRTT